MLLPPTITHPFPLLHWWKPYLMMTPMKFPSLLMTPLKKHHSPALALSTSTPLHGPHPLTSYLMTAHPTPNLMKSPSTSINSNPHTPNEDAPDIVRAQLDTGAFATCTDQLHMLHNYRQFDDSFPCPIRLLPATENSDTVPIGVGYLHIPARTHEGFLAVRTFYHPKTPHHSCRRTRFHPRHRPQTR